MSSLEVIGRLIADLTDQIRQDNDDAQARALPLNSMAHLPRDLALTAPFVNDRR